MSKKNMKRYSISSFTEKLQITTMRYHFTTTRMAIIKTIIISVGKDLEKMKRSYTAGGNVK